mmetsp:Transcript_12623/g.50464  ORF Transcript_12623/g.50464 Transcript_12623/m.50464 type:complete len:605 (-) Transcript_12623:3194-5008(-)
MPYAEGARAGPERQRKERAELQLDAEHDIAGAFHGVHAARPPAADHHPALRALDLQRHTAEGSPPGGAARGRCAGGPREGSEGRARAQRCRRLQSRPPPRLLPAGGAHPREQQLGRTWRPHRHWHALRCQRPPFVVHSSDRVVHGGSLLHGHELAVESAHRGRDGAACAWRGHRQERPPGLGLHHGAGGRTGCVRNGEQRRQHAVLPQRRVARLHLRHRHGHSEGPGRRHGRPHQLPLRPRRRRRRRILQPPVDRTRAHRPLLPGPHRQQRGDDAGRVPDGGVQVVVPVLQRRLRRRGGQHHVPDDRRHSHPRAWRRGHDPAAWNRRVGLARHPQRRPEADRHQPAPGLRGLRQQPRRLRPAAAPALRRLQRARLPRPAHHRPPIRRARVRRRHCHSAPGRGGHGVNPGRRVYALLPVPLPGAGQPRAHGRQGEAGAPAAAALGHPGGRGLHRGAGVRAVGGLSLRRDHLRGGPLLQQPLPHGPHLQQLHHQRRGRRPLLRILGRHLPAVRLHVLRGRRQLLHWRRQRGAAVRQRARGVLLPPDAAASALQPLRTGGRLGVHAQRRLLRLGGARPRHGGPLDALHRRHEQLAAHEAHSPPRRER